MMPFSQMTARLYPLGVTEKPTTCPLLLIAVGLIFPKSVMEYRVAAAADKGIAIAIVAIPATAIDNFLITVEVGIRIPPKR